ncbi:glycosyltransferase family 4 protein [Candidatus Falkowbacteria bacterium]|nr:glycosyltransferase family 4 protein [Candidatus Falkowbacteria bacterium]
MNICILTSSIKEGYGGWARYSLEVYKELKTRPSINVTVITDDESSEFRFKKIDSNLSFIKNIIPNVLYIRKISKNCEIIHALDGYPYSIIAYLASLGRRKQKFYITAIGTYTTTPLDNIYFGWLLKKAYTKAKKIFSISEFTADKLKSKINLSNIEVVYMGVNHDILDLKTSPANNDDIPYNFILSVGDLKPRKGYHISIPAFAKVAKDHQDLYYVIVGYQFNSNYFNELKELADKHSVSDKIIFLSGISDNNLKALYTKAKLLILSSINDNKHYEGFGLVYIEAGLFGVPSIGSSNCGAEDAIVDGQTGYLIVQNNIELLAQKINYLISNESLRKTMGEKAKSFANTFTWNKTIDSYIKYYNL